MMKLVMGLGNPGEEYKNNRHNIGFIILDKIAESLSIDFDNHKKKSLYARGKKGDIQYILLKPQTFMNLSGEAALYMASFMKISVDDIIVIYDDMNIPVGKFKVIPAVEENDIYNSKEAREGPLKHNGIKSIEDSLKSDNFTRIGVGIGKPDKNEEPADFLLAPFTKEERKNIKSISEEIVDAACIALFESPKAAKNKYHD